MKDFVGISTDEKPPHILCLKNLAFPQILQDFILNIKTPKWKKNCAKNIAIQLSFCILKTESKRNCTAA